MMSLREGPRAQCLRKSTPIQIMQTQGRGPDDSIRGAQIRSRSSIRSSKRTPHSRTRSINSRRTSRSSRLHVKLQRLKHPATCEAGGKRKYGERAKKAVDVPAKPPTPPRARVGGFKILNTGDKHSDDESSGSEDGGERNVRQATGKARANFARVIRCSQPPIAQPIVKSSEITPTNILEIAVESPQNRVMIRNQARRLVDIAIDEMDGVTTGTLTKRRGLQVSATQNLSPAVMKIAMMISQNWWRKTMNQKRVRMW